MNSENLPGRTGVAVGAAVGSGVGAGVGVAVGAGVGSGVGVGAGVGVAVGAGAGSGVGVAVGTSVAVDVGAGVSICVGMGVGDGSLEHPIRTTAYRVATASAERRRKRDWCVIGIVRHPLPSAAPGPHPVTGRSLTAVKERLVMMSP